MQMNNEPLFRSDFPPNLRRFSRQITTLQTRRAPYLLFVSSSRTKNRKNFNRQSESNDSKTFPPDYDSYDLKPHPSIVFRPNLCAVNIERIFTSAVPIWKSGLNELDRLTTWREPARTGCFAVAYSIFWWYRLVLPAALALIACFCIWPSQSASLLFAPERKSRSRPNSLQIESVSTEEEVDTNEDDDDDEAAVEAVAVSLAEGCNTMTSSLSPPASQETGTSNVTRAEDCPSEVFEPNTPPSKRTTTKSAKRSKKPNLAEQYRPVIQKYGGAIQNITGSIADGHERVRNLFLRRFVPPAPSFAAALRTDQESGDASNGPISKLDPNVRFGLTFLPLLLISVSFSTETIGRGLTFLLGCVLFVLKPIEARYQCVRDALDINQTVLCGVPTDRAWVLATLRNIHLREPEGGLDIVMELLAKPSPPPLPQRKRSEIPSHDSEVSPERTSIRSAPTSLGSESIWSAPQPNSFMSSSGIATPKSKKERIIKFAKRINRMTEQGTQLFNSQRLPSLALSNFLSSRPETLDSSDDHLLPRSESKTIRFVKYLSTSFPRSDAIESNAEKVGSASSSMESNNGEENSRFGNPAIRLMSNSVINNTLNTMSFFCYYGNMPGYLTIHPSTKNLKNDSKSKDRLSFYSGIGQSFGMKKSLVVIELENIIGIRKMSLVNVAGVWGGIDGIEIIEEVITTEQKEQEGTIKGEVKGSSNIESFTNQEQTSAYLTAYNSSSSSLKYQDQINYPSPSTPSSNQNERSSTFHSINSNEEKDKNSNDIHEKNGIKLKKHLFKNVGRRDQAFLKILILKNWNSRSHNDPPGWIVV